jgi:hypothetical protein
VTDATTSLPVLDAPSIIPDYNSTTSIGQEATTLATLEAATSTAQ